MTGERKLSLVLAIDEEDAARVTMKDEGSRLRSSMLQLWTTWETGNLNPAPQIEISQKYILANLAETFRSKKLRYDKSLGVEILCMKVRVSTADGLVAAVFLKSLRANRLRILT